MKKLWKMKVTIPIATDVFEIGSKGSEKFWKKNWKSENDLTLYRLQH